VGEERRDFFISYTKADKAWAEWIAWTLEEAGYSVIIQAWDFRAGGNFVLYMQRAASEVQKTIAVLSEGYLQSGFTASEWAAAFTQDPEGKERKLIPIRVDKCNLTGMLAPIIYVDLVGLSKEDARLALVGAFSERAKPKSEPAFPGAPTQEVARAFPAQPLYPGATGTISESVAPTLLARATESASQGVHEAVLSTKERLQFGARLNALAPQQFNMVLFAVNPPAGLIPTMPAAQGDRTFALLLWAEGTGGCGISVLRDLLETIVHPPLTPVGLNEVYSDQKVEKVRTSLVQLHLQAGDESISLRSKVFPILGELFVNRNTFNEKVAACKDEVWTKRFIAAVETRRLMEAYRPIMIRLAKPGDKRLVQSCDQLELHRYLQELTGLFSPRPEVNEVAERLRAADVEAVEKQLRKAEIHPKERIDPDTIEDCDQHQSAMREIWKKWPIF
jgi:hypothetical protein